MRSPPDLYFATDDLDAAFARANAAGANFTSRIETRRLGERCCSCADPDGDFPREVAASYRT